MMTPFPYIPKEDLDNKIFIPNNKKSTLSSPHCYAIIISGGIDKENNWERYWNDCRAIYSILTSKYGYLDDHIYVLMADGTNPNQDRHKVDGSYDSSPLDLNGDGRTDIRYSATKQNIISVFNNLSNILTKDDYLFVYTTDHGSTYSGNSYLCLWGGDIMYDYEFAIELNKINSEYVSVFMEQCYSGGFIPDLTRSGRVITTACAANEVSFALSPPYYNAFAFRWSNAVAEYNITGGPGEITSDANGDGFVTLREAFNWAVSLNNKPETPQFNSTENYLGDCLTLQGFQVCPIKQINNKTIVNNETNKACKIEVVNTVIQNNANVIFDAKESIIINNNFEVKVGSTLEIKNH